MCSRIDRASHGGDVAGSPHGRRAGRRPREPSPYFPGMQSFEHTPPEAREPLSRPIRDLRLRLEGSMLEKYVQQLHAELAAKGLARFRPGVYLSDEWACPDKEPVIGVPFYLADPKIAELERAINDLEDEREILMYLRHEAGHAMPRIAGKEVKWDKGTAAYEASRSGPAKDLDPATVNRLHDTALQVYAALKLRD